jgi:hypothetical protein
MRKGHRKHSIGISEESIYKSLIRLNLIKTKK